VFSQVVVGRGPGVPENKKKTKNKVAVPAFRQARVLEKEGAGGEGQKAQQLCFFNRRDPGKGTLGL